MSGFLQRLVGRAMGLGTTVHSAARLPYAPPPGLAESESPAVIPTEPLGAQRPVAGRTAGNGDSMQPFETADGMRDRAATDWSVAVRGTPEVTSGSLAASTPQRTQGQRTPIPSSPVRTNGYATRAASGTGRAAITAADPPDSVQSAEPAPDLLPLRSERNIAADAIYGQSPIEDRGAAIKLEPLLPPQPVPRHRAEMPDPSLRGSRGARPVEETTEVHVSIGRIEVTAVHEAAPPKRRAQQPAKTMTLEEYLARRRGERR